MPRATCRCGQELTFPRGGPLRTVCPRCGAKVKLKPAGDPATSGIVGDGYIRFHCPCGRRLKVNADNPPAQGQCPDCKRVVPVPIDAIVGPDPKHPETATEDLLPTDRDRLEGWVASHEERRRTGADAVLAEPPAARPPGRQPPGGSTVDGPIVPKSERGLRICSCGMPLHMAASTCRHCGQPAAKA